MSGETFAVTLGITTSSSGTGGTSCGDVEAEGGGASVIDASWLAPDTAGNTVRDGIVAPLVVLSTVAAGRASCFVCGGCVVSGETGWTGKGGSGAGG
jgi:hypothetical protein